MPFRKPVSTMGGLHFWKNIKQNEQFVMQEHKLGTWFYTYRIIVRENSKEIANATDKETIEFDWRYLEKHAIPREDESGILDMGMVSPEFAGFVIRAASTAVTKKRPTS